MWFLWIVITAIVILFNFTQLLGLIVAKVKGRSVDNFWASFAFHSGVVFVWLVLCATIEAINKYWLVNLFSWIGFMTASCFIVKRNMNEINSASGTDSDKPAAVSTIVPNSEDDREPCSTQSLLDLQAVLEGGTRPVSPATVASCITNLFDARKNLESNKYAEIKRIFERYQAMTEKKPMNLAGYMDVSLRIIEEYEKVAPYYLFDGNVSADLSEADIDRIRTEWENGARFAFIAVS